VFVLSCMRNRWGGCDACSDTNRFGGSGRWDRDHRLRDSGQRAVPITRGRDTTTRRRPVMAVMAGEPGTAVHPVTRFRAGLTVSWPHGRRLANLERLPTGLHCPRRRVQTVPRLLGWSRLFEIYDLLCEAVCGSQRALLLNSRRNFATKSSPFRFGFNRLRNARTSQAAVGCGH